LTHTVCGAALRATACENSALTVNCYEQDVIRIINAHYGRLEDNTCPSGVGTPDTKCIFTGTRDIVHERSERLVFTSAMLVVTGLLLIQLGGRAGLTIWGPIPT